MILQAIEQVHADASGKPRPIWDAIEESQQELAGASEAWLITQPAHSALTGDIAAKLKPEVFGAYDGATIRAIALHDAGWSGFDSELIRQSRSHPVAEIQATRVGHQSVSQPRSGKHPGMISFISAPPKEVVDAWTGSVETALKTSQLGGFLVSEHFRAIAGMQANGKPEVAKQMARFIAQEEARQRKLRPKIQVEETALQRLVDGLRFCDLLSLYLCAGLAEAVEFTQQIQQLTPVLRMTAADTFSLRPSPFCQDEIFSFSALRHPRTKSVSSATFLCKITG